LTSEKGDVAESTAASLGAANVVVALAADSTPQEEEEGCEEHGSPGAPREAECVAADGCGDACAAELIAGLDEGDTLEC